MIVLDSKDCYRYVSKIYAIHIDLYRFEICNGFMKLLQMVRYCKFQIVWVSKYHFLVFGAEIITEAPNYIRTFSLRLTIPTKILY